MTRTAGASLFPLLVLLPAAVSGATVVAADDEVEGILRVVDAKTGEAIAGATVSRIVESEASAGEKIFEYQRIPEGARPGEFPVREKPGAARFAVEAPGYVPVDGPHAPPVEVPAKPPFTHTFRLDRAGSLRVTFEGLLPAIPLESVFLKRVRSTPRTSWSSHSLNVRAGIARMDGLPPGTYAVKIEPGAGYELVPEQPLEIRAGETAEVVVRLFPRDPAKDAAVGVRGTVTFHEGWGVMRSEIEFRGLGGETRDVEKRVPLVGSKAGAPIPWSLGILPPGRYVVEVRPQWRTEVEVPAGGGVFDFPVPEPAVITLRVVAEESGKPLAGARVYWFSWPGRSRPNGPLTAQNADEGPGKGVYVLRVPPGTVEISADAPGRVNTSLESEADDGGSGLPIFESGEKAERRLRLPQAGSVRVTLRCQGKLLDRCEVGAEIVHSPGPHATTTWSLSARTGVLTRDGIPPGKHVLRILDEEGLFEPVPDREIVVRAGKELELTQELVRRK